MRLRVAGADNTGGDYNFGFNVRQRDNTFSGMSNLNETYWQILLTDAVETGHNYMMHFDLSGVNEATRTTGAGGGFMAQNDSTLASVTGGMIETTTTQYTGFTVIASAGTMTGSVSVYGYNK